MQVVVALCHFCELNGPSVVFTTQTRNFGAVDEAEAELLGQGYEVVDRRQPLAVRKSSVPTPGGAKTNGNSGGHGGSRSGTGTAAVPLSADDSSSTQQQQQQQQPLQDGSRTPAVAAEPRSAARSSGAASDRQGRDEVAKTTKHCRACQSFSRQHHGFVSADPTTRMHYITSQEPDTAILYGIVRTACLRSLSSEQCPGREGPVLFGSDQQGYVFSLTFYLKDSEARGRTRLCSIVVCSQDKLLLSCAWLYLVDCCNAVAEEMKLKACQVFDRDQHDPTRNIHHHYMQSSTSGYRRPEQVRSIAELCSQPQLYMQLHQSFSWILSGLFTRIQPVPMQTSTKPAAVVKHSSFDEDLVEEITTKTSGSHGHSNATVPTAGSAVPQYGVDTVGVEGPCFSSLKHIHRLLGAANFHQLANHVIRGSQIIVRSDCSATTASTLTLLGSLLPAGCCTMVADSAQYLDSYVCNLLGMPLGAPLPQHLSGSEVFVLLDIVPPDKIEDWTKSSMGGHGLQCDVRGEPFLGYHFIVFCGGSGRENARNSGPLLLQRLKAIVGDPYLDDKATVECLRALREEWMSKVHIAYRFSRRASEDAAADRPRLLQVLQVGPEELPVLQFWLRALDAEQRGVLRRL